MFPDVVAIRVLFVVDPDQAVNLRSQSSDLINRVLRTLDFFDCNWIADESYVKFRNLQ